LSAYAMAAVTGWESAPVCVGKQDGPEKLHAALAGLVARLLPIRSTRLFPCIPRKGHAAMISYSRCEFWWSKTTRTAHRFDRDAAGLAVRVFCGDPPLWPKSPLSGLWRMPGARHASTAATWRWWILR
jgi:hypothetical protein